MLFLLTNAWKLHVATGQYYLCIPFLAALFYACIRRSTIWMWGAFAGLFATCLVLTRANTLFFLLPFVLVSRRFSRRWWLAFSLAPLLMGGWILVSGHERELWRAYSIMLDEQVRVHQGLPVQLQYNDPDPVYRHWEGVDYVTAVQTVNNDPDQFRIEEGNVFHLFRLVSHHSLTIPALAAVCLGSIAALLVFFCIRHSPFRTLTLEQLTIFGCCLYMISDLCSPVYRHQYPTVQWLFPLCLTAATLRGSARGLLWLLFMGILLNIFHVPFLRMRNTLGEYLWLGILLVLSFASSDQPAFPNSRQKYCTFSG
jgi:hypothetical protein